MSSKFADWTAERLAGDEILIPVKQLWVALNAAMPGHGLTPVAFAALLEGDTRFVLEEGIDHGDGDPLERQEMEKLGFWSGPQVRLADREITAEYIIRKLTESNARMMAALTGAWESRVGEMSEEEEGRFLEIMTLAEQLSQHVTDAVHNEGEPGEP